jgi:Septum formation
MSRGTLAGSDAWPGDDAVTDAAWAKCKPAFAGYVGLPFDDSQLDLYPLTPHEDTWNASKATLICLVLDPLNDQLLGSLRAAHY